MVSSVCSRRHGAKIHISEPNNLSRRCTHVVYDVEFTERNSPYHFVPGNRPVVEVAYPEKRSEKKSAEAEHQTIPDSHYWIWPHNVTRRKSLALMMNPMAGFIVRQTESKSMPTPFIVVPSRSAWVSVS